VSEITRLGFVKSSAKTVAGATALAVLVTSQSEADTTHVGTERRPLADAHRGPTFYTPSQKVSTHVITP
jgi:hypothetical protein